MTNFYGQRTDFGTGATIVAGCLIKFQVGDALQEVVLRMSPNHSGFTGTSARMVAISAAVGIDDVRMPGRWGPQRRQQFFRLFATLSSKWSAP